MQPQPVRRGVFVAPTNRLFVTPFIRAGLRRTPPARSFGKSADLHFRTETTGGRGAFRIGERIPLTLSFSSDSPGKYKLNGATYDRSGRLPCRDNFLGISENTRQERKAMLLLKHGHHN